MRIHSRRFHSTQPSQYSRTCRFTGLLNLPITIAATTHVMSHRTIARCTFALLTPNTTIALLSALIAVGSCPAFYTVLTLHHASPIVSHRALARCTFTHSLFAILVANREAGTFNDGGSFVARVSHFVLYLIHLTRANTLTNSKENIEKHYDLGNDMYKTFLDPTMTYSSAYFKVMNTLSQSRAHAIE
jgi:hypothetical protein